MLQVQVMTPRRTVWEGTAESVFLPGDRGEYELLTHHAPLIGLLTRGEVRMDGRTRIAIPRGMVKCLNDLVVILAEEPVLVNGKGVDG